MNKKKKAARIPCTDTGNAELIAALYGDVLRYDHKQGRWLIWNRRRHRWSEDRANEVRRFAVSAARQRRMNAACLSETEKSKKEISWAFQSEDRHKLDAALDIAKSLPPVSDPGDGWDANGWLLGVANGVVDLRTGKLREATQADRITKFSPVAFDRDAKCPRFEKFLEEVFGGNHAVIRFVQKAAGYTLTGSVEEHCLFAFCGSGRNGKSTLLEVLLYLLGHYGVDLPFSVLESKPGTIGEGANLPGARFAKAVETRDGRRLDEARVKSWTGGDTISIRPLYRNSFSFAPSHKLWLAFNHKPIIADDSPAMWSRIHLICFERKFVRHEADRKLTATLKAESSGILNWAIRGCLDWQEDGLKPPVKVERATREYEAESDPLAPFFEDCCETDIAFQVPKGELWNAYQDWCRVNKEKPVSRKAFAEKMKRRGIGEGSTGSVRYWTGLRLRATDTTDTTKGCFQDFPTGQPSIEKSGKEGQIASVASEQIPSLAKFVAPLEPEH
jgi:putative DNA primase/helicase